MLAELKDKSQVTIPKPIINELGLSKGDMFDIVINDGVITLVPIVVYSKDKAEKLEALAEEARKSARSGEAVIYENIENLLEDLN